MKPHHDLAIHDMNGVLGECDQLDGVPLAGRLLVVGLFDASAGCALALRKEGPLAARVVVVHDRLRARACLGADGNCRSDRVKIADVVLLDLQLDRARPDASAGSGRRVNVVQEAAVAPCVRTVARRPFPLAPLERQPEVVVLEGGPGTQFAEHLTRDADRGPAVDVVHNAEYLERIAFRTDRLGVGAVRVAFQPRHVRRG